MYYNPEPRRGSFYPRGCDELFLRIQLQASLGGRLGRFVIDHHGAGASISSSLCIRVLPGCMPSASSAGYSGG